MINNEIYHNDMCNSLREHFVSTAAWRREKADQFPDDARNIEAANILDKLAETEPKDHDLARQAFEAAHADDGYFFHELLGQSLREVGFDSFPKDADDFLRVLMKRLAS